MNSISNAFSAPVQQTFKIGSTSQSSVAVQRNTTSKGDTATISDEGKALSKGSSEKDNEGSSPSAIKTNIGQTAAVTKATLTQALQTAKTTQKSVKAKLEAAKLQAESSPSNSDDVAKLNAKLNEINATVSKDQVKVNS